MQLVNYDRQMTCAVDAYCSNPFNRWWLQVGVGGFRLRVLHDSGTARAAIGHIELQIASAIEKSISPYRGASVRLANEQLAPILGHVELPFDVVGIRRFLNVIVLEHMDAECILRTDFQQAFNAILRPRENVLTIEGMNGPIQLELTSFSLGELSTLASIDLADADEVQRRQLHQLLDRMLPASDALIGCSDSVEYKIDAGLAQSIKSRYYKIEEEMHAQEQKMLDAGIIKKSSTEWSSTVVKVCKNNGTYRFSVDYRKVNAVTKISAYTLPYMDVILRKLQSTRYILSLDLSSAYHQVAMHKDSQHLTVLTVPGMGLYEFTRMPYGVAGGPATFQELSDKLIGPDLELYAFSYLHDLKSI